MNYKETILLLSQFEPNTSMSLLLDNLSNSQFDDSSLQILKHYRAMTVEQVHLTLLQVGYELGDPFCIQQRIFFHLESKNLDAALMLADKYNSTKTATIGVAVAAAYAASGDILGASKVLLNHESKDVDKGYCSYASVVMSFMFISLQCMLDSTLSIEISHDVNNAVLRLSSQNGVSPELCAKTHTLTIHIDVIYQALVSLEAYCQENNIPVLNIQINGKNIKETKDELCDLVRNLGFSLLSGSDKEKIEKIDHFVEQLTGLCNALSDIRNFLIEPNENQAKH